MKITRLAAALAGGLAIALSASSPALAGPTCSQVPFSDRTQAPPNATGVIFVPRGDRFRVWDNKRDNHLVHVWFNYRGVKDRWHYVGAPSDGGQGPFIHTVKEHRQICFKVTTDSPRAGRSRPAGGAVEQPRRSRDVHRDRRRYGGVRGVGPRPCAAR
jgi:hypothetical protein